MMRRLLDKRVRRELVYFGRKRSDNDDEFLGYKKIDLNIMTTSE
jgi:hypothetical protein